MSSALDTILAKLPDSRQHGASYRAPCPGHDSDNPTTLHITPIGETVLLYCHARGCSPDTILAALGLRWAELYADSDRRQNGTRATGQRTRQAKRKLTREADAISATLAAEQLDGLAYGPEPDYPSELELMAPWHALVETAWDLYSEQCSHDAVQAWLTAREPELQRHTPTLYQALMRRRAARNGQAETAERPTPLSDQYNTEAFVQGYGADMRYCERWKSWLIWDGKRWVIDEEGQVMRWAKETVKRLAAQIVDIHGEAEEKAFLAHIKKSLSLRSLEAMVKLAQSEPGIAVTPDAFDRDPWLFNVQNGTIHLRTGALQPHSRDDLCMKISPVAYDENAECPSWEQFLSDIYAGDSELMAFDQKATGYTLTGDTREQAFFLCHGSGSNGKSTKLSLMREIMGEGEYALRTNIKAFTQSTAHHQPSSIEYYIAKLHNVRFAYAAENEDGAKLSEALIKDVTGGIDFITGRHPYGQPFSFQPRFKLWLGTNHEPVIHGTDPAIWRRPRKIPFTVSFEGREDKALFGKLCQELPGILRWAVKGCLQWQRDGLEPPKAVKDATAAYRQAMDVVGRFIEERCTLKPFAKVESTALYQAYAKWCEENGETATALSQRKLAERLHERGLRNDTRSPTTDRVQWTGIGLRV